MFLFLKKFLENGGRREAARDILSFTADLFQNEIHHLQHPVMFLRLFIYFQLFINGSKREKQVFKINSDFSAETLSHYELSPDCESPVQREFAGLWPRASLRRSRRNAGRSSTRQPPPPPSALSHPCSLYDSTQADFSDKVWRRSVWEEEWFSAENGTPA